MENFIFFGFFAKILIYLSLSLVALKLPKNVNIKFISLSVINIGAVYLLLTWKGVYDQLNGLDIILGYVLCVILNFILLKNIGFPSKPFEWLHYYLPIVQLIFFKYLNLFNLPALIGISYMAFRLSYLAWEVKNKKVEIPTIWQYLSYAFFLPTFVIGPISRYSTFIGSITSPNNSNTPILRSILRIIIGATKYQFFAAIFQQMAYLNMVSDGHARTVPHILISLVGYYLYIYFNFSGFCDMVIGIAGLLGISIDENFNNPFKARNIQEFWSRWHITLSSYLKDLVFTPFFRFFAKKTSAKNSNHILAITTFFVFIIIGVWHGVGWKFFLFGLVHGIAMVAHHYYTIFLHKKLSKEATKNYYNNILIKYIAIFITQLFVILTMYIFATPDLPGISQFIELISS